MPCENNIPLVTIIEIALFVHWQSAVTLLYTLWITLSIVKTNITVVVSRRSPPIMWWITVEIEGIQLQYHTHIQILNIY